VAPQERVTLYVRATGGPAAPLWWCPSRDVTFSQRAPLATAWETPPVPDGSCRLFTDTGVWARTWLDVEPTEPLLLRYAGNADPFVLPPIDQTTTSTSSTTTTSTTLLGYWMQWTQEACDITNGNPDWPPAAMACASAGPARLVISRSPIRNGVVINNEVDYAEILFYLQPSGHADQWVRWCPRSFHFSQATVAPRLTAWSGDPRWWNLCQYENGSGVHAVRAEINTTPDESVRIDISGKPIFLPAIR